MKKVRRVSLAVMMLVLCVMLSGCLIRSAEELYALPEQSAEYRELQSVIYTQITDTQYSSPLSGTNQQPVQMADLDGDGQNEAIVFANTGGSRPLKVFIFDRINGTYQNTCVIEGDGTAFDRVEYAQLDGTGGLEIVVGRLVSNQILQSISAYSFSGGQMKELLSANYSEFVISDLDGNQNDDLFLLRLDAEARTGYGELYRCVDSEMVREPEASLSLGISAVRHINCGDLADGRRAVFVGGMLEGGGVITDIFTFRSNGRFVSISSQTDLQLSSLPVRGYSVYSADVDSDGYIELPHVVKLPGAAAVDEIEDAYYMIRWYNYEPSVGLTLKASTYHNFSGGWFLRLPDKMGRKFIVSRGTEESGVRGLVFSANNGNDETGEMMFTMYAFSGSDRNLLAGQRERFILGTKSETTFAAKLGPAAQTIGLTQEELTSMFNMIRVDWDTGET